LMMSWERRADKVAVAIVRPSELKAAERTG
jgi:hypothetical protein